MFKNFPLSISFLPGSYNTLDVEDLFEISAIKQAELIRFVYLSQPCIIPFTWLISSQEALASWAARL